MLMLLTESPCNSKKKKVKLKGKKKKGLLLSKYFGYTFNFLLTFFFKKLSAKFFMACP